MDKLFSALAPGKRINAGIGSGANSVSLERTGASIRVVNHGPNDAYFAVGEAQQTAVVPGASLAPGCAAVLAGSDVTLGISSGVLPLQIAARTETGSAVLDVYVSTGM